MTYGDWIKEGERKRIFTVTLCNPALCGAIGGVKYNPTSSQEIEFQAVYKTSPSALCLTFT
jgi:hypothetical protein